MNNVIKATIHKGKYKGEDVLISCIPMILTDIPIDFKRLQFPVRLAFAMTIDKSQGHSLSICGIDLENPCLSHGQWNATCSHVGKLSALFVYAPNNKTKNVVYHTTLHWTKWWRYSTPSKKKRLFVLIICLSIDQNRNVNTTLWNSLWFQM